ncbi:MAG: Rrf2 family transcriptional regulator [Gemmataceae bacterium]
MKISAKAEYACLAMLELAAQRGKNQPVSIKAIAERHDISSGFLIQILLQLKGAGLAASSRGASGGYQLARSPDAINLAEIIDAIDGPPRTTSALSSLPDSGLTRTILNTWQTVQHAERDILEHLTLSELLSRARDVETLSYEI